MNALVTTNAEAYRASTDAANLCRQIVVASAQNIQGRKYIKVEGWQAIAVAHGCAAGAHSVERIDGGVRAVGEVRRMSDGIVIATAEGFVGEDEPTWWGGKMGAKVLPKRSDYAIRAMAQTRAISRACRSAFAHVVVMMNAGLETTPAEEVPFGGFDDAPRNITPGGDEDAPSVAPNGIKRLTAARAKQINLFDTFKHAIWEACETVADLDEWEAHFDEHTAQAPNSWLDGIRNDIILRREALARTDTLRGQLVASVEATRQDQRGNPIVDDFPGDLPA